MPNFLNSQSPRVRRETRPWLSLRDHVRRPLPREVAAPVAFVENPRPAAPKKVGCLAATKPQKEERGDVAGIAEECVGTETVDFLMQEGQDGVIIKKEAKRVKRVKSCKMVKKQEVVTDGAPKVFEQRTAAFKKTSEWKRRVRAAIGFPYFGVEVWRPILEEFGKCAVHNTDAVYWRCHKFVSNAKSRDKRKLQRLDQELLEAAKLKASATTQVN